MTHTNPVEAIVPPSPQPTRFQQIFSPMNVTIVAAVHFFLGFLNDLVSDLLFRLLSPLMLVIALIFVSAIVSAMIIVAGWLSGLRFHRVVLGPFNAGIEGGRLSVKANENWHWFCGTVFMRPGTRRLTWTRSAFYLSAGTNAAALVALFAGWLWNSYGWRPDPDAFVIGQIAPFIFMLLPAALIVVYLEYSTGGTTILQWRSASHDEKRRFSAFISLNLMTQAGVRPRDLPAELIAELAGFEPESPLSVAGPAFRYVRALDQQDFAGAEDALGQLEEAIRSYPEDQPLGRLAGITQWVSLFHERAYIAARCHADTAAALDYLGPANLEQPLRIVVLRVTAAVLEVAGDQETAVACAREGLTELDHLPDASSWRVPFERDLLTDFLEPRTVERPLAGDQPALRPIPKPGRPSP